MVLAIAPAKPGGIRHRISVEQHELVGHLMDLQALATEAIDANGLALAIVHAFPRDAEVYAALGALIDTHDRLTRLLTAARLAAGAYDERPLTT